MEVKNAVIESVTLEKGDRGFLQCWLHLSYGGSGQGFGGYVLYLPKSYSHHELKSIAGHFIFRCMEIAGVERWEHLPGRTIRVRSDLGKVHSIGHIVKDDWFNPAEDFSPKADAGDESEAMRDMLDSARADLEVIREALGVPVEPHQSLIERMVKAAQARRGAVPDWWKPMPVESSLELAALFRGAEEAALLSGYDHADAFHCGYRAMIAAAPAAPSAQCLTCNGHGVIGGLLPAGGGYESHPCPDCAAPAAPDHSGWTQPEVRALATQEEMQRAMAAATVPTVRIGNAKVAVFDEAYVADLAEKAATAPAEVPMPKPVAFGVLNTALTGSPHRLMIVRIDIPSDDQYGGALWMPLVFAEDAQKYGDAREAAGYARAKDVVRTGLSSAAVDVLAERQRQISAEGWAPDHDDEHVDGELARAAACYAAHAGGAGKIGHRWPWNISWWKPSTPRRDLVKAGALILAEIERLDRAERKGGAA